MIALRLVRLIESHSEELAHHLTRKMEACTKCNELKKLVPRQELENRAVEIYRDLSDWLINKTEQDIFVTFSAIGKRRFEQGVPFHQLAWAILLTKQTLWDFLEREALEESVIHLRSEFELLRMLDQFYELALFYAAVGYWEAHVFQERERTLASA